MNLWKSRFDDLTETQMFSVTVWRFSAICDIHLSIHGRICNFSHAQLLSSRRSIGCAPHSVGSCPSLIWSVLTIDFKLSCTKRSVYVTLPHVCWYYLLIPITLSVCMITSQRSVLAWRYLTALHYPSSLTIQFHQNVSA